MDNDKQPNFLKKDAYKSPRPNPANRWMESGAVGKLPPQAVDMEEAVLGALMLEKDALSTVIDSLMASSFYKESHQRIYQAILTLFSNSEPIDLLTVTAQLRKSGDIELIGGVGYITELTSRVNSAANIEYHARIIAEAAIKRYIITLSSEIQKDAYEDTTDAFQLLDKFEQGLFKISESNIKKNYADMNTIMRQALVELELKKDAKDGLTGIPSGFSALDRLTSGWQRSELIILAARPGMGKCLGKGTKVLMADGSFKKVEDVRTGDLLMGDDSTPRTVKSIGRGREEMYWIRQRDAMHYRVNKSHILSLKQRGVVKNIPLTDYLAQPEATKRSYCGYKVAVVFAETDTPKHPGERGEEITIDQKSPIENCYLINSVAKRFEFLSGLMLALGAYDGNDCLKICQRNADVAQQIKFLGDSLGFRTSVDSLGENDGVFEVRMKGNNLRKTIADCYVLDHTDRQTEMYFAQRREATDWSVSELTVEYDKIDDYYGFEIDGNRLFLLEDMTVTHNTAFVVSSLRNAAVDFNMPVAIFSLEMSSVQLVNRLISAEAEIDSDKIKKGNLAPHEWAQLHHRINRLTQAPIFIDDTPALSILELRAKCRRLKQQHDIQLVVIDYLQLMTGEANGKMGGNREQEIASISRALKNLSKELNVPVIALSQLNRSVETRGGDKKPQLSDLRESGSIEQDADMVIFLYRPDYYGITQDENGNSLAGIGEVIMAKNRSGSLETVQLRFVGKYTKFSDLESFSNNDPNPNQGFSKVGGAANFEQPTQPKNPPGGGTFGSKANTMGGNFGYANPDDSVPF